MRTLPVALILATFSLSPSVHADQPLMLASMLPSLVGSTAAGAPIAGARAQTNILTGQDGNRNLYNAQLLALTAAVAADDSGLFAGIRNAGGEGAHNVANDVTKLGDGKYVFPALGLVYLSGGEGNHTLASHAALAVVKAGAVGIALKYAVGRHRPEGSNGGGVAGKFKPGSSSDTDNSFPSGHTLVAFSVASVWAYERPKEKYLAYGLASLVGLSRVRLGAHWPSDVLAGALLGLSQGRQVNNGNTDLFNLKF